MPKNERLQQIKDKLNSLGENFEFDENLLNETYGMQRLFLNNPEPPTMKDIQENWPILFEPKVMEWHFQKLVGQKLNNLETMFELKKNKLIEFGLSKSFIEKDTTNSATDQDLFLILQIITKYFGEDINYLINKWTTVSSFLL